MFKTAGVAGGRPRHRKARARCQGGSVLPLLAGALLSWAPAAAGADAAPGGNGARELSYVTFRGADLVEFGLTATSQPPPAKRAGRRIPTLTILSQLGDRGLIASAVPLPEADTLAGRNFFDGRFGRVQAGSNAGLFNPGIILVKFRNLRHVAALRVEPRRELDALRAVRQRGDVEFAELDSYERRQFSPNDALLSNQWHHAVIGSFQAWDDSLGEPFVRVAIVDTPFQMDHPDLAAHTDAGWDVVNGSAVLSASGLDHSTFCAGMAAAVIGNQVGVAGACNCRVLPININGAISEMYDAVIWAADHGVRVVNISWTGADSDTLNVAGGYLAATSRGILAMPGVNGTGFLDYTNQPNIYCISMTDAADNQRSRFGNHIDFAAPGWAVYSTFTNSGYAFGSGTSYATPLFCGVVAALFSINPTLGPGEVVELLKRSAVDLGAPGWDQYFGWGRINFAAAAAAAEASRPVIARIQSSNGMAVVMVTNQPALSFALWRSPTAGTAAWAIVTNVVLSTNAGVLTLADPAPGAGGNFYRVEARVR
jgi:subtilisin family serine protease